VTTRDRLESVAWASAVVCFCAVVFGYWHVALVAAVSAAVATMWLGCIDYCAKRTRPPEPEGVRIVHPDGSETPCELAYLGVVDGHHKWAVTNAHMSDGDELDCDRDTLAHNTFISVTTIDGLTGVEWGVVGYRMEGKA
jgi:hypothetical protein